MITMCSGGYLEVILVIHHRPTQALGHKINKDYWLFKRYLRLPCPYLHRLCWSRCTVPEMIKIIPEVLRLMNKPLDLRNLSILEKHYVVNGIPNQYLKAKTVFTEDTKKQTEYDWLVDNVKGWVGEGQAMYFYSEWNMEGALAAGAKIAKKATEAKVSTYMVSHPVVMEEIKTWDSENYTVEKLKQVDLLVLWAVGSEYATEFSIGRLKEIINLRSVEGKSTILCSGLKPDEYYGIYKHEPIGITMCFKGKKITDSVKELQKKMDQRRADEK